MDDIEKIVLEVGFSEETEINEKEKLKLLRLLRSNLDENSQIEVITPQISTDRTPDIVSIIIALGSAGFFTGVFAVIRSWIHKQGERKLTIVKGNARIEVTGYEPEKVYRLIANSIKGDPQNKSQKLLVEVRFLDIKKKIQNPN